MVSQSEITTHNLENDLENDLVDRTIFLRKAQSTMQCNAMQLNSIYIRQKTSKWISLFNESVFRS
jgi:hypothetical protein